MKTIIACLLMLIIASAAHAGAWGEGSFENDDALDWVGECVESKDVSFVKRTLDDVLKSKYVDASQGSAAVAAAEAVAAALGKPNAELPPELRAWVRRQSVEKLVQLAPIAKQALARVQDPKASELQQLWSEGKQNKWSKKIAELVARLSK